MTGYVYAIQCGEAVKIGFTRDINQRATDLRIGSPAEHRLVGLVRATRQQETECHRLLAPWRVRGEWFDLTARPVSAFVSLMPVVAPQPLPAEPNEFRDEVEAAAERLGANRAAVFKWRQRGIPTEWQIKLFEHDQRRFKFSELARLRPDSPPEDNSGAAA